MLKRIFAILLLSVTIASAEQMSVPFLKTDFAHGGLRSILQPCILMYYDGDDWWGGSTVAVRNNNGMPLNGFLNGFKEALNPLQWKQVFNELWRRKEQLEFIKSGKYEQELMEGKEPFEGFWKKAQEGYRMTGWRYQALCLKAGGCYENFKCQFAGFGTGVAVVSVAAVVVTALIVKAIYNKVNKSEDKA